MKHILFVDDEAIEAKMVQVKMPDSVIVHWMPSIRRASELLKAKLYDFELVVVDVVGTAHEPSFAAELNELEAKNLLVTSGVMAPIAQPHKFALKMGIADVIKKELGLL